MQVQGWRVFDLAECDLKIKYDCNNKVMHNAEHQCTTSFGVFAPSLGEVGNYNEAIS